MMKWIYIFCFSLIYSYSFGQSASTENLINPEFKTFEGNVYSIPNNMLKKGYGEHIRNYEKIGTISWKEINVSDRHMDNGFPDVDKKTKFGMILRSCMTIKKNSCYEFILNSDDGSKLWINGRLVIDNDGDHPMRLKKETFKLEAGIYNIKIWYFQAYPNRYGFIFDSKNVGDVCSNNIVFPKKDCTKEEETIDVIEIKPKRIYFENNLFFNSNEYQLKEEATNQLDSICNFIKNNSIKKITIIGHTDNQGTEKYNLELSQKRANSLQHYLMTKINKVGIQYIAKGKGETSPVANNDTTEGRKANRRVELILEYTKN